MKHYIVVGGPGLGLRSFTSEEEMQGFVSDIKDPREVTVYITKDNLKTAEKLDVSSLNFDHWWNESGIVDEYNDGLRDIALEAWNAAKTS